MILYILLAVENSSDVVHKLLTIVMIALFCMLSYLIIINIRTLKTVIKLQSNDKKSKIDDERYHELNNKIQLIIVVSSIIILIGGFIGYNSIDTINDDIRNKLKDYEAKIFSYDSIVSMYNKLIPELENERDTAFKSLLITKEESEATKNNLIQLQDQYRLNAKTYFIKGIKIDQTSIIDNNKVIRVYFKKLQESNNKLPAAFKKEPFLSAMSYGNGWIVIKKITREYFEYNFLGTFEMNAEAFSKIQNGQPINKINPEDATSFDLIIIEGVN